MASKTQADAGTDRDAGAAFAEAEERVYVASSLQLMWWKFKRHKLALVSGVFTIIIYLVAAFCEFVAPYDPDSKAGTVRIAPPSRVHVFNQEGKLELPFIYGLQSEWDANNLRTIYTEDTSRTYRIRLFVQGEPYKLWGRIPSRLRLVGLGVPRDEQGLFLTGTDTLGRDLFSRVVYGARLSLSIGIVGVVMSMTFGLSLGGLSGYYGGAVDNAIQRVIEFIRSVPSVPLWMALSAALPTDWPIVRIYFGITLILSFLGWTGMARVVRGRFLSLREEDFVLAAKIAGTSEWRMIWRHMLPCFASHIIASMTLSIPSMILAETSLSFLGLGLRDPAISWGVLLSAAQNVASIVLSPWRLWAPGICVVASVLAINFVGDGLRDAADPYSR